MFHNFAKQVADGISALTWTRVGELTAWVIIATSGFLYIFGGHKKS